MPPKEKDKTPPPTAESTPVAPAVPTESDSANPTTIVDAMMPKRIVALEVELTRLNSRLNSDYQALQSRCDMEFLRLAEKLEKCFARLSDAESRPKEATPKAERIKLRSHEDLMHEELTAIEKDDSEHIAHRMAYGLSEAEASKVVQERKAYLRTTLATASNGKNRRPARLAVVILLLLLSLVGPATAADMQGYPSTWLSLTNLPAYPLLTLTNGTGAAIAYSQNSTATNYIPLRTRAGLGLQSVFAIPVNVAGAGAWTNGLIQTNATGSETIYVYPSVDGTNAINTAPWATLSATPNVTNAVIFGTNWSELQLRGYAGLFLTVSNGCSLPIIVAGSITNIQNGQTNVYAAGVGFNRPNL